jgi:hypothetical protein
MKAETLITLFMEQLPALLPPDFTLEEGEREVYAGQRRVDVDIRAQLRTPTRTWPIVIEIKNADRIASIREAASHAKHFAQTQHAIPFVASVFLGERARAALKEEGVGYLDLAGNFYLRQGEVYVEKIVADNPFGKKPPLKNLFAPISSRITRALLVEPTRTWRVSELAEETKVSLGQASAVAKRMVAEEFLSWNSEARLQLKDATALLEAWKQVYPTYGQQQYFLYSYEQGYDHVLASIIRKRGELPPFAFAFFTGASFVAPFIRGLAKAQVYIEKKEDIEQWKRLLDVTQVVSGGNIELVVPYDQGVFYKSRVMPIAELGEVPIVSAVQLYMDLFSNPARGAEQAEHLRETKLRY